LKTFLLPDNDGLMRLSLRFSFSAILVAESAIGDASVAGKNKENLRR